MVARVRSQSRATPSIGNSRAGSGRTVVTLSSCAAFAQARTESAALDKIYFRPGADPYVEGVEESILAYGDAETADPLESVLVKVIELLERLVGDSMATKLIERSIASAQHSDAKSNERPEAS